jgi:hypothetical protein
MICPKCHDAMDVERTADGGWRCDGCDWATGEHDPLVTVTTGSSSSYHSDHLCEWLNRGQQMVSSRGGQPAPRRRVPRSGAQRTHAPCAACTPPEWKF